MTGKYIDCDTSAVSHPHSRLCRRLVLEYRPISLCAELLLHNNLIAVLGWFYPKCRQSVKGCNALGEIKCYMATGRGSRLPNSQLFLSYGSVPRRSCDLPIVPRWEWEIKLSQCLESTWPLEGSSLTGDSLLSS